MTPRIPPRPPETVMRLSRLGSSHAHRLSFMRQLLRRAAGEDWRFERRLFEVDGKGVGRAVYCLHLADRSYSLVAFAHDLPPELRSDRVIATAWDATFCLFDGIPSEVDLTRLAANIPLQEAGRVTEAELSVSRANRSVRFWDHCVERLAAGRQPDPALLAQVGYLMRTTAVYGSGKLGAADREVTAGRPEFQPPFQIEMMSVWLTRAFVADLCEHMARARNPKAATFSAETRKRLGIGNATGLGMAPFLINHPVLLHNWIAAREEALARVRSIEQAGEVERAEFEALIPKARTLIGLWTSDHPLQQAKTARLAADWARLEGNLSTFDWAAPDPWNRLFLWAEAELGEDAQEFLASLLMEPHGALVDGLAECMAADEAFGHEIDGAQTLADLGQVIARLYPWALGVDWQDPGSDALVWYVSEEKLEPRLGPRQGLEPFEQPLSPGRDVARLWADLGAADPAATVATFLRDHPQHRHILRRVQTVARFPYAELRDNTIASDVLPIDLLRAKLAFFGAQLFDPRSDRWVRITMFRGAPYPGDLATAGKEVETWPYPA